MSGGASMSGSQEKGLWLSVEDANEAAGALDGIAILLVAHGASAGIPAEQAANTITSCKAISARIRAAITEASK